MFDKIGYKVEDIERELELENLRFYLQNRELFKDNEQTEQEFEKTLKILLK